MKRPQSKPNASLPAPVAATQDETAFAEIVGMIESSRHRAAQTVNAILVDLYWSVGEYISRKIQADGWGKGTVEALSAYVQQRQPGIRGFSSQNLWRMRQFFETYGGLPNLSTLLRELPWSSHLHILSRAKRPEEREFYLRMAVRNRWQVREVARQMDSGLFEQTVLHPPKLSPALRELHPQAEDALRDAYFLEFLGLPTPHSESDLHAALLRDLGRPKSESPSENPQDNGLGPPDLPML
jgi:predicted nuclease of restriction endonuclease-like (RecB) superfamily